MEFIELIGGPVSRFLGVLVSIIELIGGPGGIILGVLVLIIGVIWCYGKIKNRPKGILFIDDQINDFEIVQTLRNRGYTIETLPDLSDINSEKVKNAKIIFVDFKGVGKNFGPEQGVSLIKALREKYGKKKKIIIVFSTFEI